MRGHRLANGHILHATQLSNRISRQTVWVEDLNKKQNVTVSPLYLCSSHSYFSSCSCLFMSIDTAVGASVLPYLKVQQRICQGKFAIALGSKLFFNYLCGPMSILSSKRISLSEPESSCNIFHCPPTIQWGFAAF